MAKVYTTSTATMNVPVILSFTCPKCGQSSLVQKKAVLSAQSTVRGYNSSAANMFAQQNLAASAGGQVNTLVSSLRKGNMTALLPADSSPANKGLSCPHCHLKQIVECEGKRKTLRTGAYAAVVTTLVFVALLIPILFASLSAASGGQAHYPGFLPGILFAACIAALVAVIVSNRRQSQRAYDDPALMERRYHSVLNPRIQATLMLGIGNAISVYVPEDRPTAS